MLVFSRANVALWGQAHEGNARICDTALCGVDVNHWWALKPLFEQKQPWTYVRDRQGPGVLIARTSHHSTYDVEFFWDADPAQEAHIAAHVARYTLLQAP
jgi:hypothetical protein